jgi:hypothetical protein
MSVPVTFGPGCNRDIRRVRTRTATTVCKAVFDFARDGSGKIIQVDADDEPAGIVRVRVHGWAGFAVVEVRPHELYVHGIFPRGALPPFLALLDEPRPPPHSE